LNLEEFPANFAQEVEGGNSMKIIAGRYGKEGDLGLPEGHRLNRQILREVWSQAFL
jgi:hypothetical protein